MSRLVVVGVMGVVGVVGVVAMAVSGCGQSRARHGVTGAVEHQPIAVQIAAVRAGTASRVAADRPLTGAEWESLRGLGGLRELVVERGVADDGRAEILATLPDLERLVLRDSPLCDAGFGRLAACTRLIDLNVPQAACTSAGIRALAGLEQLRSLRIGSGNLAGVEACAAVAALPHLATLHLIDVPIGDEGLMVLASCAGLRTLYLDGAGVSDGAWTEYFQSRPSVHVHVDQAHHDRDPRRGHD